MTKNNNMLAPTPVKTEKVVVSDALVESFISKFKCQPDNVSMALISLAVPRVLRGEKAEWYEANNYKLIKFT